MTEKSWETVNSLLAKAPEDRTPAENWEIAEANRGLAKRVVRKFCLQGYGSFTLAWDDLGSEAMLALYKAASKFDPSRGFRYSTLATVYVRNHLLDALQTDLRATGGTREKFKDSKRVAWVQSLEEVAEWVSDDDFTSDELSQMGSGEHTEWTDEEIDRQVLLRRLSDRVARFRPSLTEQERTVLDGRLTGKPFADIGEEMGVTKQRAEQAWQKLKPYLMAHLGDLKELL